MLGAYYVKQNIRVLYMPVYV